jgi:nucleotide-binding universal stress UspA family protein
VVGSHGHGSLYNLLVGSVAEGVIRHAGVPVVVVPGVPPQPQPKP